MNVDRESTLLGMQFGQATGANQNYSQMQKNLYGARTSAAAANASAWNNLATTAASTNFPSGGTGTPVGPGDPNTTWGNYPGNPTNQ